VTGSAQRPLLFLDVDGPLIPFGGLQQYPTYQTDHELRGTAPNPLLARINPQHGPRLMALPCNLVWATTWMADANEAIAPRIGLPQLPGGDLAGAIRHRRAGRAERAALEDPCAHRLGSRPLIRLG
jgi:hypothetical protein